VAHVTEVGQLMVLVGDISNALVDLGSPPILRIPQDLGKASDVLEVALTVQECLRVAYAFGAGPWD
jgi:hypothetical protein